MVHGVSSCLTPQNFSFIVLCCYGITQLVRHNVHMPLSTYIIYPYDHICRIVRIVIAPLSA
jgi:hypothetical protein